MCNYICPINKDFIINSQSMSINKVKTGSDNLNLMKSLHSYKDEILEKILTTDLDKNVFLMMKFRSSNKDLSDLICKTFSDERYNCVRADNDEWDITYGSVLNPIAVLYCCKYGVALFDEPEENHLYSPNVAYELGVMHALNKTPLILINDSIIDKKPFDLTPYIHSVYTDDSDALVEVKKYIEKIKKNEIKNNNGIHTKASVAIVKNKENKFLFTFRRNPELDFTCGFPAKKVDDPNDEQKLLIIECYKETGILINPLFNIGTRVHPVTKAEITYWYCDYVDGELLNKDTDELSSVKWLSGKEILEITKKELYGPVNFILKSNK